MSELRSVAESLVPAMNVIMRQAVQEATEEVVRVAVTEFETRLRKRLAQTAMEVAQYFAVDAQKDILRIEVKLPTPRS